MENSINNITCSGLKICKDCGIKKNINEYTNYSGKLCKECYRQKTLDRVKKHRLKNKKEKPISDRKICKQCNIEKYKIDFHKSRNICISCFNINRTERYIRKKDNKKNIIKKNRLDF
jgi:hypothetical protein